MNLPLYLQKQKKILKHNIDKLILYVFQTKKEYIKFNDLKLLI